MAMLKDSPHVSPYGQALTQALSPEHPKYDTILVRANQIQRQKDIEQQILAAVEKLLDVGFDSTDLEDHHAAITDIKDQLTLLQPSDYDSLKEERNINGKCGYVLCAQLPQSERTKAHFRIITGRGKGIDKFTVVPRKELEQWCSER